MFDIPALTGNNSISGSLGSIGGSLTETTILNAVQGGGILSIINSTLKPAYSITFNKIDDNNTLGGYTGQSVFEPSSWISVNPTAEANIANAPVELGSFTSINKIQQPRRLNVVFTLEGWTGFSGAVANYSNLSSLSREQLLTRLELMRKGVYTYDISTPDTTYVGYDLARFDYSIKQGSGVTLLTIDCTFQEVMDVAETSVSTSDITNNNTSSPIAMSTQQVNSGVSEVSLNDAQNAYASVSGNNTVDTSSISLLGATGQKQASVARAYKVMT